MWQILLYYVSPFIGAGLLVLLWAFITSLVEDKYPRYYKFSIKLYDNLPKIVGIVIVVVFIYFYFTYQTTYDIDNNN